MKIGHVHLKVRDLHRSVAFYERYFGMRVTEQLENALAFLSDGPDHHELALQQVGRQAATPSCQEVGL